MDARMMDLYALADRENLSQMYLQELSEQCGHLELQLIGIMENLPTDKRKILEAYIDMRNELEFQSVKVALKVAKGK